MKDKQSCTQFEGGGIKSIVLIKKFDTITDSEGRMYVFSDAEIVSIPVPKQRPNYFNGEIDI